MRTPESLQPSSTLEKFPQGRPGPDLQVPLENPPPSYEGFCSTLSRISGPERDDPHNEPKEVPGSKEESVDREREIVTAFDSALPSEKEPRQRERKSDQSIGGQHLFSPRGRNLEAFKAGFKNRGVRVGYLASGGGILLSVLVYDVSTSISAGTLMSVGPLGLLIGTSVNHYRILRKELKKAKG